MAGATGVFSWVAEAQAISTAITIFELTAAASEMLEILDAWVENTSSTTSAQMRVELLRKSGTITGTASPPAAVPLQVGMAASGSTVKWKATGEGTDGVIVYGRSVNVLNGWFYLPVPEARVWVPPSGLVALKFPATPPNISYSYGMTWRAWA